MKNKTKEKMNSRNPKNSDLTNNQSSKDSNRLKKKQTKIQAQNN